MPNALALVDHWLAQLPELEILADIARIIHQPIRIRGGVPRNLLARALRLAETEGPAPSHLIDLVDPLSDIDLVVPTRELIEPVFAQVFGRLALASFCRWEGKTSGQVASFEERGAMTSLDGVEIVITGDSVRLANADAALRDLEDHRLTGRVPLEQWTRHDGIHSVDAALFALRVARFAAQFGLEIADELTVGVAASRQKEGHVTPLDAYRLDLAALDVLLTAESASAATERLRWARDVAQGWLQKQSRILTQLEDVQADHPARVIAYPRVGREPPRVHLETGFGENPVLRDEATLLPWTAIRVPMFSAGACCPPSDFALGPLVIAWRGISVPEGRVGVVALAPPADPYETASRFVFGVPGLVTTERAVVQRLDWGFIRYLAGGGRLVYVGARHVFEREKS